MRTELDFILDAISQSSITDGEWATITIAEDASRLVIYQTLITLLGTREGISNALERLKSYAYATDGLVLVLSTGNLAATAPQSNVYLGNVLE